MRFLSLAPQADTTRWDATSSHFLGYQRALREAARAAGHAFTILAPEGCTDATAGLLGALPRSALDQKVVLDHPDLQRALDEVLTAELLAAPADGPLVLLRFEGKLQELGSFARLAARHPAVTFVWNLFVGPSTPSEAGPGAMSGEDLPSNLIVLADSAERHGIAGALGLPSRGVWPIHSELTRLPPPRDRGGPATSPRPLRVLIPLAGWHSDAAVRRDVRRVVRAVRRTDLGITFTVGGDAGPDPSHRRWLRRMSRMGVAVEAEAVDDDAYVRRIDAHDVVWIPHRSMYRVKTSGKAIDALVRGKVVVAAAGTFPAREFARWVPCVLDYRTEQELIDLLDALPAWSEFLGAEMRRRLPEILSAYSPDTALATIVAAVVAPPPYRTSLTGPRPEAAHGGADD